MLRRYYDSLWRRPLQVELVKLQLHPLVLEGDEGVGALWGGELFEYLIKLNYFYMWVFTCRTCSSGFRKTGARNDPSLEAGLEVETKL